jgi:hypothetical protein
MNRPDVVRVRIDAVEMRHVVVHDARHFATALGDELHRLLADRGVPSALAVPGATDRLRAGPVAVGPAGLTARRLAEALYAGWSR